MHRHAFSTVSSLLVLDPGVTNDGNIRLIVDRVPVEQQVPVKGKRSPIAFGVGARALYRCIDVASTTLSNAISSASKTAVAEDDGSSSSPPSVRRHAAAIRQRRSIAVILPHGRSVSLIVINGTVRAAAAIHAALAPESSVRDLDSCSTVRSLAAVTGVSYATMPSNAVEFRASSKIFRRRC